MARRVTFFPAVGQDSRRRTEKIRKLVTTLGYELREETNYTVRAGAQAQLCDDVVIYDLSGFDDSTGPYRALQSYYVFCDHVLLVSRDCLPLNLLPPRPGGAPPYPYPLKRLPDGRPVRFPTFTIRGAPSGDWIDEDDHSIMTWLRSQLEDLAAAPVGPRLPRAGSERRTWPIEPATLQYLESLQHPYFSSTFRPAFLSYRGHLLEEAIQLAARVADTRIPGSAAKALRIVSPTEFAIDGELMSAARRWMVVAYLRMLIFNASEFWILRTDDYLDSWWTLAELVYAAVAIHKARVGVIKAAPAVRIVEGVPARLSDDLGNVRVRLSDRNVLRVEEITAMTAPGVSSTMPGGEAHKRSRDPFWDDLLIDRRTLGEKLPPYEPSVNALIDGLNDMVVIRQKAVVAGVAGGGTARAEDRRELSVVELPPRILFDRPLESDPRRPVLRPIPTYYVLH